MEDIFSKENAFSYGCVLATVISFDVNHSVPWAIIHGFFSWLYVIYYLIKPAHIGYM